MYETVVLLSKGKVDSKKIRVEFLWNIWICQNFRMGKQIKAGRDLQLLIIPGYADLILNADHFAALSLRLNHAEPVYQLLSILNCSTGISLVIGIRQEW